MENLQDMSFTISVPQLKLQGDCVLLMLHSREGSNGQSFQIFFAAFTFFPVCAAWTDCPEMK